MRTGLMGALGLVAAACSSDGTTAQQTRTPTPSSLPPTTDPSPSPALRTLAWRRIDASGPGRRRDHTLTGFEGGAVLFGGRRTGTPLADLWVYEDGSWTELPGDGPSARFGHNAIVLEDGLIVFGGQGRGDDFFNDVWRYDLTARRWTQLKPRGTLPAKRYGASSIPHGDEMIVSHGFTFQGRFDDTRGLRTDTPAWRDLTPSGRKPVERCLHRAALLEDTNQMLLFGGQTTGKPYLGDTWVMDIAKRTWRQARGAGPSARNLYALIGVGNQAYLFGGFGADGALADTWNFDGAAWRKLTPDGEAPPARGGVEGALVGGTAMLVFGGATGSDELDDLWELTLPGVASP